MRFELLEKEQGEIIDAGYSVEEFREPVEERPPLTTGALLHLKRLRRGPRYSLSKQRIGFGPVYKESGGGLILNRK